MSRTALDFASMAEKIRSMKSEVFCDTLIMHPKTLQKLMPVVETEITNRFDRLAFQISIKTDDMMPERRLKEHWNPPAGGRFFELTADDESWARPLGLGTVEQVDLGPLIYAMSRNMFSIFERPLLFSMPNRSIIYGSC